MLKNVLSFLLEETVKVVAPISETDTFVHTLS